MLDRHEVCRVSRTMSEGCFLMMQEVSFLDDHHVCQRYSIITDAGQIEPMDGLGRFYYMTDLGGEKVRWENLDYLRRKMTTYAMLGYQVEWNQGFIPPKALDLVMA